MRRKIIYLIIIFLAIFAIFIFWPQKGQPKKIADLDQTILYYSQKCPHCLIVENYIKESKVDEKISFLSKEISQDQKNLADLIKKADFCGIAKETLGVPFLWAKGECYTGDAPIINFFNSQIKDVQ